MGVFLNKNLFSSFLLNFIFKMIYYLIYDPKKIRINLELYFESYEFSDF